MNIPTPTAELATIQHDGGVQGYRTYTLLPSTPPQLTVRPLHSAYY